MKYTLDELDIDDDYDFPRKEVYQLQIFSLNANWSHFDNYEFDTIPKLERFLIERNFDEVQPYGFLSQDLKSMAKLQRIYRDIK